MKKERILIIEDEILISAGIQEMLNKFGYVNIESADNAEKGTELLTNNNYDIVLMDIHLGQGADGIDLITEMKKKKKEVPVIYLTGNYDMITLNKAKTTTPLAFITKPVSETNLRIQLDLFTKKS
jgi:two-component system, response regulator PdtaR